MILDEGRISFVLKQLTAHSANTFSFVMDKLREMGLILDQKTRLDGRGGMEIGFEAALAILIRGVGLGEGAITNQFLCP